MNTDELIKVQRIQKNNNLRSRRKKLRADEISEVYYRTRYTTNQFVNYNEVQKDIEDPNFSIP